ncbi:MAG: ATP-dependent helicase [Pseudomonadota bacterium]|nr:ATP-dependent helicase [Pseudomonadota bacterium]
MLLTSELNAQQQEAVTFGLSSSTPSHHNPLLIIAGAGTGKTNTLAHKTAQLILKGVAPERILLMTFARRAASELSSRANRIVERTLREKQAAYHPVTLPWMGTFHSIASRLLREHASSIGLQADFTVMDRNDSADMIDLIRHELGFSSVNRRFPKKKTCLEIYSRCVNAQAGLADILESHFPYCAEWEEELTTLFSQYAKTKIEQVSLDYDDLLLYGFHMAQVEAIATEVRKQFDYILVDEYQDTNVLQAGILKGFFPTGEGLTVVGDDAQSIYSFRSATIDNILNFPTAFSLPGKVISLQQNYRSHPQILALSNALLDESSEGYKVELYSERKAGPKPKWVTVENDVKQAEFIVERILAAREEGIELKQQAVLFRSSYHSDRLELELTRRNIPFVKHGGLKFLEAAHVKDVLCILRWADNPKHKISAFRVLKLLPGIGPKIADKVFSYLESQNFLLSSLQAYAIPESAKSTFKTLATLLEDIHSNKLVWAEQTSAIATFYKELLEVNYDDHFVRYGDIEQLSMISQQFTSRERFLTELTLDPPQSSGDLAGAPLIDDDYLILSTVHSAKGQEWKNVFVLNVADGNFPNEYAAGDKRALEEERRLLYVAITRAKDELSLIQPLKYWVPEQQKFGDKHVYGAKSRFFTDRVCAHMEPVFYPKRTASEGEKKIAKGAIADIKKNILGMWDNQG